MKTGTACSLAPREVHLTKRPGVRRRGAADHPRWLVLVTGSVFVILLAPIAIVVTYSFNSQHSLTVLQGLSLRWYRSFIHDRDALASLGASLRVATATMVAATVIGSLLALGIARARRRWTRPVAGVLLLSLVAPEIATAVAALLFFTRLGMTLSLTTVTLAHVTFSIAYVAIVVGARISGIDLSYEEAAMDLGASEIGALRYVLLPLLWPAILASALLVFVLSFDDFVTTYFASGSGVSPLPVLIYGMLRIGVSPEINAIGTSMMLLTLSLAAVALTLLRLRRTVSARHVAQ